MSTSIYEILNDIADLTTSQLVRLADTLNVPLDNLARNSTENSKNGKVYFSVDPAHSDDYKKIQLIKAIREQSGLGLKDAKEVSEGFKGIPVMKLHQENLNQLRRYADQFGYIVTIKQD